MKNTETLKNRIYEAIDTIVNYRTTPHQIDFTPYSERIKLEKAKLLIESLPIGLSMKYYQIIDSNIEEYYSPNILGENGQYYSVAQLDSMF